MPRYPVGYGTTMVSLARLREIHEPLMHPEFARRLFPWIEAQGGLIGIGGGWRATGTQPDKPGFAPEGRSFHQTQLFASGFRGYAAVDLVARNDGGLLRRLFTLNGSPANPDATTLKRLRTVEKVHRAPTWAESTTAPDYGLHTFIAGEPWHMQCIEMRGWSSWVNDGRPDPQPIPLPTDPSEEDDDMAAQLLRIAAGRVDPANWGPTVVVRGTGPARRVNAGPDLANLTAKLGEPRDVAPGSTEEAWLIREVRGYDRMYPAS